MSVAGVKLEFDRLSEKTKPAQFHGKCDQIQTVMTQ